MTAFMEDYTSPNGHNDLFFLKHFQKALSSLQVVDSMFPPFNAGRSCVTLISKM